MLRYAAPLCSVLISSALVAQPAAVPGVPVEVGLLSCNLVSAEPPAKSDDQIGEGRDIECRFRPGLNGPEESYVGTIQIVGQHKSLLERGALMLVAKAPLTSKASTGLLQQQYAAGKSSREGPSQGPLVGERDNSIVLHPLAPVYERPVMALGQPPVGLIVMMELRLKAAPA